MTFRALRVTLVACFLTLPQVASAADSENRFAIKGAGAAKCSAFMQAYESRSNDAYLFAGWISGYITALNQHTADTFDLAPWQSTDVLMLLIRDLCGRKPEEQVYRAAGALASLLAPDRLTALGEVVEMKNGEHQATLHREIMKKVQERLKDQGLYKSTVDGSFGPATQKALEGFQEKRNLPKTGVADQQTLVLLMYQVEQGAQ
jgi:hypothetical protein